jgi:UDP-3-O-[3-hydroxymyristoyl] glucosamine N-acyltransferase
MQFQQPVPVAVIAEMIHAKLLGEGDALVKGINEIHKVEKGDLVFVDHPKYYEKCLQSAASFIIINREVGYPPGKTLLIVDDPFEAYQEIVDHYRPFHPSIKAISDTAVVGTGTILMPGSYLGNHVTIGNNCVIHPNVVILDHCHIGNDVVIQAGTVIGSDAFYYNRKKERDIQYRRMHSCGRVIVENNVEIGANCTIDRGVSSDTVIGAGTRIDNLVHIGHDTVIGRNCLFAAQVGVAGATTIEDGVILWGQVGVNKTITIGSDAIVLAQSGVRDSIPKGKTYFGSPAEDAKDKMKDLVWIKRIPLLWEKLFPREK